MSIVNTRNPDDSELSIDNTLAKRLRWDTAAPSPEASSRPVTMGRKPTDLRKLSEWIQVQRKVAELKKKQP